MTFLGVRKMKDLLVLRDLECVKAIAHPRRIDILNAFDKEPLSAKQLSEMLDEPHAKINYHIKTLYNVGILELVEEKIKYSRKKDTILPVDNVDKFVHNLIIGGFADFCHVENFLESFSLIHHGSTSFVHIARTTFSGLILPVSARTCLMLPILSDFISSLSFCSFLWCFSCVRS